jgi:hypothetical protein
MSFFSVQNEPVNRFSRQLGATINSNSWFFFWSMAIFVKTAGDFSFLAASGGFSTESSK